MSTNVENIVINVDFQTHDLSSIYANEVQVVPGDIAWEDLELMLKIYANSENIKVSYTDDDYDLVLIESQDELQEAFKVAKKSNNTLKITVTCDGQHRSHDLFDVDREPIAMPTEIPEFVDLLHGKVLYRNHPKQHDPWLLPRGVVDAAEQVELSMVNAEPKTNGIDVQNTMGNKPQRVEPKPFFIVNQHCRGMVLDVECARVDPGTCVIVWYKKSNGIENQLWYKDEQTATIRSCLNDFCLDVVDGSLVVNPLDLNRISQKWTIEGSRIQNVFNSKWVIGMKKKMANACDKIQGLAEEELVNIDWVIENPECQAFPLFGNLHMVTFAHPFIQCSSWKPYTPVADQCHARNIVVVCDLCDEVIDGIRYKCGFCPDFDLCATCEAKGVHDPTHLLLKMLVPQEKIQLKLSTLDPVLMRNGSEFIQPEALCREAKKLEEKKNMGEERSEKEVSITAEENYGQELDEFSPGRLDTKHIADTAESVEKEEEDMLLCSGNDEMLNCESKMVSSSPTVPSNTPMVGTPPRTPLELEPAEMHVLDCQSQSIPRDAPCLSGENLDFVNMAVMADLVHKKMSDLVTDGEYEYVDVERLSQSSSISSSSSSSSDFYVVPIPDCFNPNLPARKEASTTVVVKKSDVKCVRSMKSVDDMLRTSTSYVATEPLLSPVSCFSVLSVDGETEDGLAKSELVRSEESTVYVQEGARASGTETFEISVAASVSEGAADPMTEVISQTSEDRCTDADADAINSNEVEVNHNRELENDAQELQQEMPQEEAASSSGNPFNIGPSSETEASRSNSSGVEAGTLKLMSSVFTFVTRAAKDVFYTLQDKNSYIPPRSDWMPSHNQWMPSASQWTPRQQPTWTPPQWNPTPANNSAPFPHPPEHRSPMDQLIEMGFADRGLNQQLLDSCGNNVEAVVQKLVDMSGNMR